MTPSHMTPSQLNLTFRNNDPMSDTPPCAYAPRPGVLQENTWPAMRDAT